MSASADALAELQGVLATLLGPEGCPWDKEQTPVSLWDYEIEEANELVDAVRGGASGDVCGEMGDVMFLLLFLARLYADRGEFTLAIRQKVRHFNGAFFKDRTALPLDKASIGELLAAAPYALIRAGGEPHAV